MKPTVLIKEDSIASLREEIFAVTRDMVPCSVFCDGLGVGETLGLKFLSADVSLEVAQASDWTTLKESGSDAGLDADNNMRPIYGPGIFKISITAATGPVRAGIY